MFYVWDCLDGIRNLIYHISLSLSLCVVFLVATKMIVAGELEMTGILTC